MTAILEASAITDAQRAAFAAKLEALLDQRDQLAEDAVRRAWVLLEDLRRQVATELTTATGFDAYHLPKVLAAIERLGRDFAAQYQWDLSQRIDTAWALGHEGLDAALSSAGVSIGTFALDTTQLALVHGMTTDLITRISADTIAAISTEIQRGVLGGQTVFQTMRRITDLLGSQAALRAGGSPTFVAPGIAYRAELIARTEMLTAYDLANYARSLDAVKTFRQVYGQDGMMNTWYTAGDGRVRLSHVGLHGKTVKVGQEFKPGLRFPHDPRASAKEVINCRCRVVQKITLKEV